MYWFSEKEYSKILDELVIVTVDTLLIDKDSNILLGKRIKYPIKDLWIFGGRMQANDTYISAAKKGLLRELNIEINDSRLSFVGYYDLKWDYREESPCKKGTHVVLAAMMYQISEDEKQTITKPSDHEYIKWYSKHEIETMELNHYLKDIINDANKMLVVGV